MVNGLSFTWQQVNDAKGTVKSRAARFCTGLTVGFGLLMCVDYCWGQSDAGGAVRVNSLKAVVGPRYITEGDSLRVTENQLAELKTQARQRHEALQARHASEVAAGKTAEAARTQKQIDELRTEVEKAANTMIAIEQRRLVDNEALLQEIKTQPGFFEPPGLMDELVENEMTRLKLSRRQLFDQLVRSGRTMQEFRDELFNDFLLGTILRQKPTIISPAKIEEYYKSNLKARYEKGPSALLYLLQIPKKDLPQSDAEKLAASLKSVAAFNAKVTELKVEQPGLRGWINAAHSGLRKELVAEALTMKAGDTALVGLDDYWFILFVAQVDANRVVPIEDARRGTENEVGIEDFLRDLVLAQQRQRRIEKAVNAVGVFLRN